MADHGSTVYTDYIAQQLAREETRKASLESRGLAVMTTSGGLATLLLGFTTLTKKKNGEFLLPHASHLWVKGSLILFTAAALTAIATNLPFWMQWASVDGLRSLLKESWEDSMGVAEREVSDNRLDILASIRRGNGIKSWIVVAAMACEGVAVGFIAAAVWYALPSS
jgi:hypothetical protein